jgi:hypothetical protein
MLGFEGLKVGRLKIEGDNLSAPCSTFFGKPELLDTRSPVNRLSLWICSLIAY